MKKTNIPWCHSAGNPVMGCDGCELWPPARELVRAAAMVIAMTHHDGPQVRSVTARIMDGRLTSEIYADRMVIVQELRDALALSPETCEDLLNLIREKRNCYAGLLGTMRAVHPGYAGNFERPTRFPGRMAKAAHWGPPTACAIAQKPWLAGLPRLIFVSDMGDALSSRVSFEYLDREIIGAAISEAGERHLWLWLAKRPERMAGFGTWLLEHGGYWPENLVAMTTITGQRQAWRAEALRKVLAACRGLSLEPLLEPAHLDLAGINWLIVGGGSDVLARPLDMARVRHLRSQCAESGVAFFMKQLGRFPLFQGASLKLKDSHGGDWSEWPSEWRVRQMPEQFYRMGSNGQTGGNTGESTAVT